MWTQIGPNPFSGGLGPVPDPAFTGPGMMQMGGIEPPYAPFRKPRSAGGCYAPTLISEANGRGVSGDCEASQSIECAEVGPNPGPNQSQAWICRRCGSRVTSYHGCRGSRRARACQGDVLAEVG